MDGGRYVDLKMKIFYTEIQTSNSWIMTLVVNGQKIKRVSNSDVYVYKLIVSTDVP